MSDDVTIEQAVSEAIGECAGYVSLCWEPRPHGVFDSTSAAAAVEAAVARAHSAMREERAAAFAAGVQAFRDELRPLVEAVYDEFRSKAMTDLFAAIKGAGDE